MSNLSSAIGYFHEAANLGKSACGYIGARTAQIVQTVGKHYPALLGAGTITALAHIPITNLLSFAAVTAGITGGNAVVARLTPPTKCRTRISRLSPQSDTPRPFRRSKPGFKNTLRDAAVKTLQLGYEVLIITEELTAEAIDLIGQSHPKTLKTLQLGYKVLTTTGELTAKAIDLIGQSHPKTLGVMTIAGAIYILKRHF